MAEDFVITKRNPGFLGVPYGAGFRMVDERTRVLAFTASGRAQGYKGPGQRWSARVPLIDRSDDQRLRRMLLSSQEVNQLSGHVMVPVMQDANICFNMPLNPSLIVTAKADSGQSRITIRSTVTTTPVKLYTRWFLKFNQTNHHKIYNISTPDEHTTSGTTLSLIHIS